MRGTNKTSYTLKKTENIENDLDTMKSNDKKLTMTI